MIEADAHGFAASIAAAEAMVEPALARALADELVALTDRLNALACDLGCDAEILRRHMTALQAIDGIVQVQLAVAGVLRAGTAACLSHVPVEAVGTSLTRRYLEHRAGKSV